LVVTPPQLGIAPGTWPGIEVNIKERFKEMANRWTAEQTLGMMPGTFPGIDVPAQFEELIKREYRSVGKVPGITPGTFAGLNIKDQIQQFTTQQGLGIVPGTFPGINPQIEQYEYSEAEKRRRYMESLPEAITAKAEKERRTEQLNWRKITQPDAEKKSFLDQLLQTVEPFRGTLGGMLGKGPGLALDLAKGVGKSLSAAGGAEGGLAAAGAAAAGPVAIAAAVFEVTKMLKDGVNSTIDALGTFATRLVSPDVDPAQAAGVVSDVANKFSDASLFLIPQFGLIGIGLAVFTAGLGGATSALENFMTATEGMVERYSAFSPELAMTQAQTQMINILGDIQRAGQITPTLTQYLQVRTELQQQFENTKIRILEALMPIAIKLMHIVEFILPFIELMVNLLALVANKLLPNIGSQIDELTKQQMEGLLQEGFQLPDVDFPFNFFPAAGAMKP
jgi:hypothetical protein